MKSGKPAMPLPTDYLDANAYLRDYFQFRKQNEDKFSFDVWAKELGLKSRSYLRMILIGKKRISPRFVEAFNLKSGLADIDQDYFYLMVQYTYAKTQIDRRAYSAKMIQLLRTKTGVVEIENHFRFLSNPVLPRIMTLLTFDDFEATPESVARSLDLDGEVVRGLLKELEEIGLASKTETSGGSTVWKATVKVFKIPNRFGDLALTRYHEATLQDAAKALRGRETSKRFRSLIFPLNENELEELYKVLDEFMSSTFSRFVADQFKERRLYQLNSSLFPVSTEPAPGMTEAGS